MAVSSELAWSTTPLPDICSFRGSTAVHAGQVSQEASSSRTSDTRGLLAGIAISQMYAATRTPLSPGQTLPRRGTGIRSGNQQESTRNLWCNSPHEVPETSFDLCLHCQKPPVVFTIVFTGLSRHRRSFTGLQHEQALLKHQ